MSTPPNRGGWQDGELRLVKTGEGEPLIGGHELAKAAKDAEFHEEQHKRAKTGQFAKGGGGKTDPAIVTQMRISQAVQNVIAETPKGAPHDRLYQPLAQYLPKQQFDQMMRLLVETGRVRKQGDRYYPKTTGKDTAMTEWASPSWDAAA